jgi:hypothetical protein
MAVRQKVEEPLKSLKYPVELMLEVLWIIPNVIAFHREIGV